VGGDGASETTLGVDTADVTPHPALEGTVAGTFTVRPGVQITTVFGGTPATPYTIYDITGTRLLSVVADEFGHAHFSYIPFEHETIDPGNDDGESQGVTGDFVRRATTLAPGDGYVMRDDTASPPAAIGPFSVLAVRDHPDPAIYEGQDLHGVPFGIFGHDGDPQEGLNYIEMRDGTKLSAMVRFPDAGLWGDGPYPTVIEYSGYAPSQPEDPDPGSRIATLLGYASVGVNMRGTGCSGGVFDIFSPAQHSDAYDIVEVVARQPWVLHGKVGMVGLSYPGIAQIYAAYLNPPGLAAVSPLSILSDPWELLRPGGIYNDGFTRQWLEQRDSEASSGGQRWTDRRIEWGDPICAEHQNLRNQNLDFESVFRALEFYPDDGYARSIKRLLKDIRMPVYLSGGFQDEQTGPQFADVLDQFENAPVQKFVLYNGRHADGYSPLTLTRWWEFLEIYVAKRVPRMPDWVRELAAPEFSRTYDSTGLGFEEDRFATYAEDDYAGVKAAYEAEPDVRVVFESGGGDDQPGAPKERFSVAMPSWPSPVAATTTLYLGADGTLGTEAGDAGTNTWRHDPEAGGKNFFGPRGYQTLGRLWDIDWTRFADGDVVAYETAPLETAMVLGGPGYAALWVQSVAADIHVQVTLTELRPDGQEVLIQSGWMRVGHGTLDEELAVGNSLQYTWREEDFVPPVAGQPTLTRVPIPSVGHVLRAGSQLRLAISAPGRNHATWQFTSPTEDTATHTLLWGAGHPSALVLTRLDGTTALQGVDIPADAPSCIGLRGQPCRAALPIVNHPEHDQRAH